MEAEVFASGWRGVFWVIKTIAFFTVDFSHLHVNLFEHGLDVLSGNFAVFARNSLTPTLKYIVVQT